MLSDLKLLEDKLYLNEAIGTFLNKHSVHSLVQQLNKATKKDTRDRIKYCFSKVSQSPLYHQFLLASLTEEPTQRKQFQKYISSEHSEQFFTLLQRRPEQVLQAIEKHPPMLPTLISLVSYEHGIKLVKLFSELYSKYQSQCLFSPAVPEGLTQGLGLNKEEPADTVAQMRYLEIVVDIAIRGGKCFQLVEKLLSEALKIYKTEDILLKMSMAQVIVNLGEGIQTAKLLREHSIWKLVQKDACDPQQQFYVKKFLLTLLVDMFTGGYYELSPKVAKHIHEFLSLTLRAKGEELQAAVDLVSHLFRSTEGCRLVIQNIDVLNGYIALSRSTQDGVKRPYYQSLVSLTHHGCQTSKQARVLPKYRLVINILNCIGKPNLTGQINHNLHANNFLVYGLEDFSKWFSSLLQLPFEEAQLILLQVFHNLLNYYEVVETLFQVQDTTKYLLRAVNPNDRNKTLRTSKSSLLGEIVEKGKKDWDGQELSEYSRNLEKMLKGARTESVYALDVE